jgi:hypothetical protein
MEAHVRKLTLDVHELKVETFEVARPEGLGGTVHANVETRWGDTCVTQCVTGPCDCYFTEPSCDRACA